MYVCMYECGHSQVGITGNEKVNALAKIISLTIQYNITITHNDQLETFRRAIQNITLLQGPTRNIPKIY